MIITPTAASLVSLILGGQGAKKAGEAVFGESFDIGNLASLLFSGTNIESQMFATTRMSAAKEASSIIKMAAPGLVPRSSKDIYESILDIANSAVKGSKGAESVPIAALKVAAHRMITDPRFASVAEANKSAHARLVSGLLGADTKDLGAHMDSIARMFEGVQGAPDLLERYYSDARKMLSGTRPTVQNPMSGLAQFNQIRNTLGGIDIVPESSFSTTDPRYLRLEEWKKSLGALDATFDFSEQEGRSGIRSFDVELGGEKRRLTFAQFRTKAGESFNVPLDDLENYKFGDYGYLYLRDKSAQTFYSPAGKVAVMREGETEVMSGMEFLFGKGKGLLNVLEDAATSNRSIMDQLVKFSGDVSDEPYQILQLMPQGQGMLLGMANQYAQMKFHNADNMSHAGMSVNWNRFEQGAAEQGYDIFAIGSPGAVSGQSFFWTQAQKIAGGEHPTGTALALGMVDDSGEFTTMTSVTRRPARLFNNPLNVINPGSSRAMANLPLTKLHMFADNTPVAEMVSNKEFSGFVQGTFYLKGNAKVKGSNTPIMERMLPGEGLIGDISGQQASGSGIRGGMSVMSPTTSFDIRVSRPKSPGIPISSTNPDHFDFFHYNPKLQRAFDEVERLKNSGVPISPEERRNAILRAMTEDTDQITGAPIYTRFSVDEFLGTNIEESGIRDQFLRTAGHAGARPGVEDSFLYDVIPSEEGYTLVFGKETPIREGVKLEGSAVGTLSESIIPATRYEEGKGTRRLNQEYVQRKAGILGELAGEVEGSADAGNRALVRIFAPDINTGSSTEGDLIETIDEVRILQREGNIRGLRTQQQSGLAMIASKLELGTPAAGSNFASIESVIEEINGIKVDGAQLAQFQDFMKKHLGGYYASADTEMLAKVLLGAQDILGRKDKSGKSLGQQETKEILGLIFGLEDSSLTAEAGAMAGGQAKKVGIGLGRILGVAGDAELGFDGNVIEEGTAALRALGLSENFLRLTKEGIEESTGVVGLALRIVRGVPNSAGSKDARFERRQIDHIFYNLAKEVSDDEQGFARHLLYNVAKRSEKGDPMRGFALASAIQANTEEEFLSSVKAGVHHSLDLDDLSTAGDPYKVLEKIKKSGGYIIKDKKRTFIPGEELLHRLSVKDSRGARYTEDLEIRKATSSLLNALGAINYEEIDASHNVDILRNINSLASNLSNTIFQSQMDVANSAFEGRIEGALTGQVFTIARRGSLDKSGNFQLVKNSQLNKKLMDAKGYTVGVSRDTIIDQFSALKKGKNKEEIAYLNDWMSKVLRGEEAFTVAGWQHPQISAEATSVFAAYYDETLDEYGTGAFRFGHAVDMNPVGKTWKKVAGLITGKLSSDHDGDTASIMILDAIAGKKGESLEEKWKEVRQLMTSPEYMARQFDRQKDFFQKAKTYESSVKKAVAKVAGVSESSFVDIRAAAYIKGAGQENVGRISNKIRELHVLNSIMRDLQVVSQKESKEFMSFLQGFEQFAVGFKHASVNIVDLIENALDSAMSPEAQNTQEGLLRLADFLEEFGLSSDLAQKITGSLSEAEKVGILESENVVLKGQSLRAQYGLELMRQMHPTIGASRKAEKVKPQDVIEAGSGVFGNATSALNAANPAAAELTLQAAADAISDTQQEAAKIVQEGRDHLGETIGAINTAIKDQAKTASSSGPARTLEQSALNDLGKRIVEARAEGINKYGRVLGVGGLVAAGVYALFNKGYDDEPLTDVPPPPPGQERMHATQADLQGVRSGSLLDDHLTRQQLQMAEASSGYGSNQIGPPNSMPRKSYLNGATARISNRSLIVDKTNPIEYARAIKQIMPGSQVNLQINNRYSVPSDIERQL